MQNTKLFFDFYLNASIHVALAVFAYSRVTRLFFNIPDTKNVDFVIFLSTIIMYNFIKYGSRAKRYYIVNVKYEKRIQIVSFLAGSILFFLLFRLALTDLLLLGSLGVLSLLYIVPIGSKQSNLRNLSTLKIYIVALVWSLATVILPLMELMPTNDRDIWITFVQRFFFVTVLVLPFEIRDMGSDAETLQTLPRKFGVRNTKILGYTLLILLLILEIFKNEIDLPHVVALTLCAIMTFFMLGNSKQQQSFYYAAFWVESIPIIFWLLYTFLFRFV
ncbi:hypothetical protein ACJD0Z_04870 [Flavobacteriaceae bacterium M23B6Z8]